MRSFVVLAQGMSLLGLGLLSSCKTVGNKAVSQVKDVPGSVITLSGAQLGQAYDTLSGRFLPSSCFAEPGNLVEFVNPPINGIFTYTNNATFDKITDYMKENVSGNIDVQKTGISVGGKLSFSTDSASSDYRTTMFLGVTMSGGLAKMKPVTLDKVPAQLTGLPADVRRRCGDQFLSQVELTASLAMTITFDFKSKTDKETFEASGALKYAEKTRTPEEVKNGLKLEVQGDLNQVLSKVSDSALVTIRIVQNGGDATKIASAIDPVGIVKCGPENRNACVDVISKFIGYAVDFDKQFNDAGGQPNYRRFALTSPLFASYDTVYSGMVTKPLSPAVLEAVSYKRRLMLNMIMNEQANFTRLESLVNSPIVNDSKRRDLTEIMEVISDRILLLAQAYALCTEMDDTIGSQEKCLGVGILDSGNKDKIADSSETLPTRLSKGGAIDVARNGLASMTYDETKMVLVPTDFREYCTLFKTWNEVSRNSSGGEARAEAIMNTDARLAYLLLRFQCEAWKGPVNKDDCKELAKWNDGVVFLDLIDKFPVEFSGDKTKPEQRILSCATSDYLRSLKVTQLTNNFDDLKSNEIRNLDTAAMYPNLQSIDIYNVNVKALDGFWLIPRLSEISISDSVLSEGAVRDLTKKPGLVKLSLPRSLNFVSLTKGGSVIYVDSSTIIGNMPDLADLNLQGNTKIANVGLMKQLPSLTRLVIAGTAAEASPTCAAQIKALKEGAAPKLGLVIVSNAGRVAACKIDGVNVTTL